MRIKLHFKSLREQILPCNHLYGISCWIYSEIANTNALFAKSLHASSENKGFSFSYFYFNHNGVVVGENMENHFKIEKGVELTLIVNFINDDVAIMFLQALSKSKYHNIANIDLVIEGAKKQKEPKLHNNYIFKAITPIHITTKKDRKFDEFIHPNDDRYEYQFFSNLNRKSGYLYDSDTLSNFSIDILSEPNPIFHRIKGSVIKAYKFDFTLNCPRPLMRIGYDYGFGKQNSQGFGFVK